MSSGKKLSVDHKRMLLEESQINARVVVKRGYRTVTSRAELERLGFGRSQRNVPALLVPVHGPDGEISLYQSRPDEPRIGHKAKPVKYETPKGARMALDVHPACRSRLGDPSVPLFVTEGVKKGDALVSRGVCAVALIGVWNWRGTNELGGKTALPDWEYVALNGRKVYVVFDSDVMEKREVHEALRRFKDLLERRRAEVRVVYLPAGNEARKQGVDDYLAAGHSVDDLLELATKDLKGSLEEEVSGHPYRASSSGIVWDRPTQNGPVPTPLTNFRAKITADVARDDGAEVERLFEIEATLPGDPASKGRRHTFTVPAGKFVGMAWPTEYLGAGAIVYPGFGTRDHARTAVQILSGDVPEKTVYSHTGWREVGGEWIYLHAGGAVGGGTSDGVRVELSGSLEERELPEANCSQDVTREAVRESLRLLKLAPGSITLPLLAATFRAPLGEADFSVHLAGSTGEGKSELASIFQQHFGAGLDSRHLLSWESTENAIEAQAFALKDQLLVLDDFAPSGTVNDVQRWHKKADRVLRAQGNRSGRQRMRADTSLRPEKPPRALILSTGEDVPRGQSLRARMLILELTPGTLVWEKLTDSQNWAASGVFAWSMSSYVEWLSKSYGSLKEELKSEHAELRKYAGASDQHRRTPGIVADLALGLRYFLRFAYECGAVDEETARKLWIRGWRELGEAASGQSQHQVSSEPTSRFRELLSAALASGRAHVAGPDGEEPEAPEAWGWRRSVVRGGDLGGEEWRPQGERIGWTEGKDLYLEPDASLAVVQKQGRDSGDSLTVTGRTLRKRLHEKGLLVSVDEARQVLTIRRSLGGRRRVVLHTPDTLLSLHIEKPDQPDQAEEKADRQGESAPDLWSGSGFPTRPMGRLEPDQAENGQVRSEKRRTEPDHEEAHTYAGNPNNGRVGQVRSARRERESRESVRTPSESAQEQESGAVSTVSGVRPEVVEALEELLEDRPSARRLSHSDLASELFIWTSIGFEPSSEDVEAAVNELQGVVET